MTTTDFTPYAQMTLTAEQVGQLLGFTTDMVREAARAQYIPATCNLEPGKTRKVYRFAGADLAEIARGLAKFRDRPRSDSAAGKLVALEAKLDAADTAITDLRSRAAAQHGRLNVQTDRADRFDERLLALERQLAKQAQQLEVYTQQATRDSHRITDLELRLSPGVDVVQEVRHRQ